MPYAPKWEQQEEKRREEKRREEKRREEKRKLKLIIDYEYFQIHTYSL
jgi:hypothetical protein